MAEQHYYGTGRRKTSSARVFMRSGTGSITINDQSLEDYFGRKTAHMIIRQPLNTAEALDQFDSDAPVPAQVCHLHHQRGARLLCNRALDRTLGG